MNHWTIALLVASAVAIAAEECCSPDFIFVVDITDDIGFSPDECDEYVSQFMSTTVAKNSQAECDQVAAALIEYGARARVRFNFNKYSDTSDLEAALAEYQPGASLGATSNARAGFAAVRLLLSRDTQGHRSDATPTVFWLVRSTPTGISSLNMVTSRLVENFGVQIVVVAVGDKVDAGVVDDYASPNGDFFLRVDDVEDLYDAAKETVLDYCPTEPNPTTPEPETTTCEATTLPNPTQPPQPADDFCFQCRNRRNQKDHYADPTDCHHFYQCFYYNETFAMGLRRVCPPGQYWRESVLTCMPEGSVPCFDRCEDDATAAKGCYAGTGCRQFFVCNGPASYGMCCPEGTQFNEATCSCEETETCFDACVQQGPAVPTTVAPSSRFNATVCLDSFGTYISTVAGDAGSFILIDAEGNPTEIQRCAVGVEFSLDTCSCSVFNDYLDNPVVVVKRQALLWLPFNSNLQDESVNRFKVYAYDGAERDTTDSAHGDGSLALQGGTVEIPGLKSYDFRSGASWCTFFRCNGACASGGILNNNRDEVSEEFTVRLATNNNGAVVSRVQMWHPVGIQSVGPASAATGWNHVCVNYDSNAINLFLNGARVDAVGVSGYLSIAHCPYTLGFDHSFGRFDGNLDDVLFTPFAMTEEEMNAHRNGDHTYLSGRGFF